MSRKAKEPTVAKKLFTTLFHCKIPELHRHDETYLREVGHHVTGDKAWDKELMHQLVDVYLTPVRMVTLFSIGSQIVFHNPRDALVVYDLIKTHLENWQRAIEQSLHPQNPPMDDLRLMEEFAEAIYPLAKVYMNKEAPVSGFMGKLMGMGARTPLSGSTASPSAPRRTFSPDLGRRFRQTEEEAEKKEEVQQVTSIHQPIADYISRMRFKRTGEWQ
jgi:hypothetical protein